LPPRTTAVVTQLALEVDHMDVDGPVNDIGVLPRKRSSGSLRE
jgi:hypothetical protein